MRKINAVAAGVTLALAVSGSANATLTTDFKVFMSGATAPSNMIREHLVQNVCDQSQPINVYVDIIDIVPDLSTNTVLGHTNHFVVECTAGPVLGAAAQGKTMAVYKFEGGSSTGTTPVANRLTQEFMNADKTACTLNTANVPHANGGTYNLYECGTDDFVQQVTDGGVSDVEPTQFVGILAGSSGNFIDNGNLVTRSGPGLVFGVGVSLNLRNELQARQIATGDLSAGCVGSETEACMPSLPSPVVRSITNGQLQNWDDQTIMGSSLSVAGLTHPDTDFLGLPVDNGNRVHLCRRKQGSGTHAQFMIHYNRTNCQAGTDAMISQPGGSFGASYVYESSSSSTLGSCIAAMSTGAGVTSSKLTPNVPAGLNTYGIGYQSTEKNGGVQAKDWRFVKIDGVAPTLENAFNGEYREIYYMSIQNVSGGDYQDGPIRGGTAPGTANADVAAIDAFWANGLNISGPVAAQLNRGFERNDGAGTVFWQGGFLIPSKSAPAVFDANNPLTPFARETSFGAPDSCRPLTNKR